MKDIDILDLKYEDFSNPKKIYALIVTFEYDDRNPLIVDEIRLDSIKFILPDFNEDTNSYDAVFEFSSKDEVQSFLDELSKDIKIRDIDIYAKRNDITEDEFNEFIEEGSTGFADLEQIFNLDSPDNDYKVNLSYDKYKSYITEKYLRPYIEKVTEDIKTTFTDKGIDRLLIEYLDLKTLKPEEMDYFIKRGKNVLSFRDNIFIEDVKIDMSDECIDEINELIYEIDLLDRMYGALIARD